MLLSASDIQTLIGIARVAGQRIMPFFRAAHGARQKEDRSPVTDADIAAHNYIFAELTRHFPAISIISEEDPAPPSLTADSPFFLVDPLDGTRSFVRGEDEFTVNIALIENAKPVFGVVDMPTRNLAYFGGVQVAPMRIRERGSPEAISVRPVPHDGLTVTRSRSAPSARTQAFLHSLPLKDVIPASSSIKLCWVAEGSADIYPRFGRTMEWDIAAGQAILEAAGGRIETVDGEELRYGKPGFENPGFIAYGI